MKKVLFLGGECEAFRKLTELLPKHQVVSTGKVKLLTQQELIGYDAIIAKQGDNGLTETGMDLLKIIHERNPDVFRIIPSFLVSRSHRQSMIALCLKWGIGLVESIDQVVPLPRRPIIVSQRFNREQPSA
ncbi:MAG: hypothetical protein WC810_24580 [Janthinobacterium sp.]|jgi:hypothetical protein